MKDSSRVYAQYRGMIKSMVNSIVVNNPSIISAKDLQQAGALALVVALKSYDSSQGAFSSYVRRCIRNALLEQANSFNKVFTVDEKVRRQVNAIIKARTRGVEDSLIMKSLGIKTTDTFLSLVALIDNNPIDCDQIDIISRESIEINNIFRVLDEIDLNDQETKFINLTIDNRPIEIIMKEMDISRSRLYTIKASIRDKIVAWGQND